MTLRKTGRSGDQTTSVESAEQPPGPEPIRREASTQRPLDAERVREIEDE
jgi:hypothetical protein